MTATAVALALVAFALSTGAAAASAAGPGEVGARTEVSVGHLVRDTATDDRWIFSLSAPQFDDGPRVEVVSPVDALDALEGVGIAAEDTAVPLGDGGEMGLAADKVGHASGEGPDITNAVFRDRFPFNRGDEPTWHPARRRLRRF